MKKIKFITIGDVSNRTGVAISALRYYETLGLLSPIRSSSGQRRFLMGDIRRVSFITLSQKFGFSLTQIGDLLKNLPEGRNPTKADWSRISRVFQKDINRRISELEAMRDKLDGCIGCGCLSLKSCKLYNPDDIAGRKGAGAQFVKSKI